MIFYTLQDALNEIKPRINGGSCNPATAIARINQAQRRILNRPRKPVHIRRLVRFFTRKDTITLPREVERILHYTMDGVPSPLFSQAYEFVSGGPGELTCNGCIAGKYLEDRGNHYSTMFDIPSYDPTVEGGPEYSTMNVHALSTSTNDFGLEMRVSGRNGNNEQVGQGDSGKVLGIVPWDNGTEGQWPLQTTDQDLPGTGPMRDVTWVSKPITEGFVSLYAKPDDSHQLYFLAKYHPHEVNPRYRRYRITSPDYCCGSSILAWCELGHVPLIYVEDVLVVQNLDALKLMTMAIEMENERDFQMAKAYEADAYRLLDDQRDSERTHDYNLVQVSAEYGFGGIKSR